MSSSGAIRRGRILYEYRDNEGNLPLEISSDTHKMEEIEAYKASLIPKAKPKVAKTKPIEDKE